MKKLFYLCLVAIAAVSCTKSDLRSGDRLTNLLIGKDTLQMYIGETRQLPLTVSPSNYDIADSIKWKSSDTSVLTINTSGLLTAKKLGSSVVTLTNLTGSLSVSATVAVSDSLNYGLIAFYPLNNTPNDLSGHSYNGTAHNVKPVADRFGNANGAYAFAGDSSSYVMVPDYQALRLHDQDFSINVWINLAAYNYDIGSHILSKRTGDATSGFTYSVDGYGNYGAPLGVQGFGIGGGANNAMSNTGIALSQWHMFTVTYSPNNNTITFYKDGVFDGATTNVTSPPVNNMATMYIGKDSPLQPTTYYLQGTLSELRIYGRKLRVGEITKLFKATSTSLN